MYNKFFNSKYPIIAAAMNGGSDLNLAIACHEAGIFPNLVLQYHLGKNRIDYDLINESLKKFVKNTGGAELIFTIDSRQMLDLKLMKILKFYQVSHLEFFPKVEIDQNPDRGEEIFGQKYDKAVSTMIKYLSPMKILKRTKTPCIHKHSFAYCLKGSESAGFNGKYTTMDLFLEQKKLTPDAVLIPYGGIGTPEHVVDYISKGATAVAVGTLLAASKESPLSIETKTAMINYNSSDIIQFSETGQNALVLGNKEEVLKDNEHWNRLDSLKKGLYGDGKSGHIYAGKTIDYVNEIKSVKEIVQYLTSKLKDS